MALTEPLRERLLELADLDPEDISGWMHLYSHEAQEILKVEEDAMALRAIRELVLKHNVSGAALRTLLASPTTETLQGIVRREVDVPLEA